MADLFWLSDEQWAVVGSVHAPRTSLEHGAWTTAAWCPASCICCAPAGAGATCRGSMDRPQPSITGFNRWSRRGFWRAMLAAVAEAGWIAQTAAIDSTYTKAHRCAHGGKGGRRTRRSVLREAGRPQRSTSCPTPSAAPPSSHLTPGNSSDVRTAPAVLTAAPGRNPAPFGRQGLRRRLAQGRSAQGRHRAGDPRHAIPKATDPL